MLLIRPLAIELALRQNPQMTKAEAIVTWGYGNKSNMIEAYEADRARRGASMKAEHRRSKKLDSYTFGLVQSRLHSINVAKTKSSAP
ncbi:hypothetical protein C3Z06_08400 [Cupriavidus metallidurans]|nr:hypothetical protein C3Z06_08400 [Cupriavidus metallidurans]